MNAQDEQLSHYETIRTNFEYCYRGTSVLPTLSFEWFNSGTIMIEMYSSTVGHFIKIWLRPWRHPNPGQPLQYVLHRITYGGYRISPERKALQWQQILNNFTSIRDGRKNPYA